MFTWLYRNRVSFTQVHLSELESEVVIRIIISINNPLANLVIWIEIRIKRTDKCYLVIITDNCYTVIDVRCLCLVGTTCNEILYCHDVSITNPAKIPGMPILTDYLRTAGGDGYSIH